MCCSKGHRVLAVLQKRDASGPPKHPGRSSGKVASGAHSNSVVRGRARSSSRHAGASGAPVAASAPHALHVAAARLGCDLVRINGMHDSAVERTHRGHAHVQHAAEWPSATARWSPRECIFRSSKTHTHGQHVYNGGANAAHLGHSEEFLESPTQMHPDSGPCFSADTAETFPAMSRISETTSSTLADHDSAHGCTSEHAGEDRGAGGVSAAPVGFGTDHNRRHRYSAGHTGETSIPEGSGGFGGFEEGSDCEFADDAGDQAEWLQLRDSDCDPGKPSSESSFQHVWPT